MEGNLNALTTIFTEFYYWVTVVFMFLIHVGFCMYEVGRKPPPQSHAHADEEHDADPAGHRHVLLLRLVDLLGVSKWPGLHRRSGSRRSAYTHRGLRTMGDEPE